MKHKYIIEGMTCNRCKAKVEASLQSVIGVIAVDVDLESKTATVSTSKEVDINDYRESLPEKYTMSIFIDNDMSILSEESTNSSKLKQLKPLFLILLYISVASVLLHRDDMVISSIMTDFMGLFLIVFSFFKMLDISGFAQSFAMYDPLAHRVSFYGYVYPFVETILGLMLLLRFEVNFALILMIIVLGVTTYGVTKTLLDNKSIKCACLGTALNLPMTEATFIENAIMIIMGCAMLMM